MEPPPTTVWPAPMISATCFTPAVIVSVPWLSIATDRGVVVSVKGSAVPPTVSVPAAMRSVAPVAGTENEPASALSTMFPVPDFTVTGRQT